MGKKSTAPTAAKSKTQSLPPGTKTPVSGQWKNNKTLKEVTSVKGEPLPPGPKGSKYSLEDKTRH